MTGFTIVENDRIFITYETGIALVRLKEFDSRGQTATLNLCDIADKKFLNIKDISFRRAVGQSSSLDNKKSNSFFEVSDCVAIKDCLTIAFDPHIDIYPGEDTPKILGFMGCVSYMSSFGIVNLSRDPFDRTYQHVKNFGFEFFVKDYSFIGSDKCIAVSREGWIVVGYEVTEEDQKQSFGF